MKLLAGSGLHRWVLSMPGADASMPFAACRCRGRRLAPTGDVIDDNALGNLAVCLVGGLEHFSFSHILGCCDILKEVMASQVILSHVSKCQLHLAPPNGHFRPCQVGKKPVKNNDESMVAMI